MDIEIEQKDNKIQFLEDKRGLADSKVIEEMNRSDLNKISNKRRNDRIMIRSKKKQSTITNTLKTKNNETKFFTLITNCF